MTDPSMQFADFSVANLPRIVFGSGVLAQLPAHIAEYGRKALLLTGARSFTQSAQWASLRTALDKAGVAYEQVQISGEPSPQRVDEVVAAQHAQGVELVVAIGGGSVLDAGKAIAGLLPSGDSVLDYLEDVGKGLTYTGPALPFIAVPTSAGTGSEATKNAVLSVQGEGGYKKSFRHDSLVARLALIDPNLLRSCPPELMAAQGMDAITQLLESYVSVRANPFTDALAWSGLQAAAGGFFAALEGGESEAAGQGRAAMAYAALLSGITLAQVGLGSVHGLAQPLGSLFAIPHGVACGTTLAAATAVNIRALQERAPDSPALHKYAQVGRLLATDTCLGDELAVGRLLEVLAQWTERLSLPRLSRFGISEADLPAIVANSRGNSMKTNPVVLSDEEVAEIVRRRL